MPVSEKEQQQINTLVRGFEAETGIDAVAAVVGRADAYPEIPWKAYAVGSAFGALVVVFFPLLLSDWSIEFALAFHTMAILGAGALLAAASAFIEPVARLFLDRVRAQAEARQYALSLFVEREIFRTPERRAVLMLVSRFERVALVIPDSGLASYAMGTDLERIAVAMRAALVSRGPAAAFEAGFDTLRAALLSAGYTPGSARTNMLEDGVVTSKGA
jgi:putative membrane protein